MKFVIRTTTSGTTRLPFRDLLLTGSLLAFTSIWASAQEPAAAPQPSLVTEPTATARSRAITSSLQELTSGQDRLDIQSYQQVIAALERNEGAYSPNIAEHLLGLGGALQQAGQHAEAIAVFKRGVHLSRINSGLYGADQIPLLQSEIRSHVALGEFAAADERQVYLYRVQLKTLSSGPQRANALMQQASWQKQAYELRLGEHGFNRLMNMWDLYRLALNDILAREGEHSAKLLPPLYGMLRAQYLISDYQDENSSGFGAEYNFAERQDQGRFNAYRTQSYKKGLAVIQAIHDIEVNNPGAGPQVRAQSHIRMGDWMLWHAKDNDAMAAYQHAVTELAALDDAQVQTQLLLGTPTALPALEGVDTLPPLVEPSSGNALLEFNVTETGRLVDLDRIDVNEDNEGKVNRLMRQLRKTQFRPRFEGGAPVATDNVVWAYDSNTW